MNWWEESAGFVAFGLNVAGNLLLTNKRAGGWWIRIASNVAQLVYAVLIHSPSLALNAVTFAGINILGIVKWRKPIETHAAGCGLSPCNCGRLA